MAQLKSRLHYSSFHRRFQHLCLFAENGIPLVFSFSLCGINVYSSAVTALQFKSLPPHCGISLNSFCLIFFLIIKKEGKPDDDNFPAFLVADIRRKTTLLRVLQEEPICTDEAAKVLPAQGRLLLQNAYVGYRYFDCTEDLESNTSNCKMTSSE